MHKSTTLQVAVLADQTRDPTPNLCRASEKHSFLASLKSKAPIVLLIEAALNSIPGGLGATVYYVDARSTNATEYTTWDTAAATIQDAVYTASTGDEIVVTNGIYSIGARPMFDATGLITTNRLVVDKRVSIRSVNGPSFTVIDAAGTSGRCVYLLEGASLCGFTLTHGVARRGGGVFCQSDAEVVSNCVISSNTAPNLSGIGGGVYGGTLNNCILYRNSAGSDFMANGGGAAFSTLNNCTLVGNSNPFTYLGVADHCTLNNCIIYDNSGQNYHRCNLNFCCTSQLAQEGLDNSMGGITAPPLFVNLAGGDFRLQSNSPCINAGKNIYVAGTTDVAGNPRITGGTVDIGAYEYQSPASAISYAWLQSYNLPTDGSADITDSDGDGLNNWQEWRCGTDPMNALSALRLLPVSPSKTGTTVVWQSVPDVNYFLERCTNLASSVFTRVAEGLQGQLGTTSYRDTNAPGNSPVFYRVGIDN